MGSRRTKPRKRPTQERSKATVDALVEATARVLVDEGEPQLTTNRVAEVAGVSVGSLYQYFPNKEALVAAVIERRLAADEAEIGATLADAATLPLRDALGRLADVVVSVRAREREFYRAILPLVGRADRFHEVRAVAARSRVATRAWLESRRAELRPDLREGDGADERLDTVVFLGTHAIEAALNMAAVERPELLDRASFAEGLVAILEALWLGSTMDR